MVHPGFTFLILLVAGAAGLFFGDDKVSNKLTPLKVEQCGGDNHTFHLRSLSLKPYPIVLPSNLSVSFEMEMEHLVLGPFDISLKIYRSALMWVKIPCMDGVGSCTYKEICQHPEGTDEQKQIEKVFGFPLQGCIIPKFNISMTLNDVALPDINNFVTWLAGGDYKIEASIRNKEKVLACIRLFAKVD